MPLIFAYTAGLAITTIVELRLEAMGSLISAVVAHLIPIGLPSSPPNTSPAPLLNIAVALACQSPSCGCGLVGSVEGKKEGEE